jgi:1-deoxy-D-xylulose-5-phosphate reductoisomerase
MRVPIAYGLSFPERFESGAQRLDFLALAALSFEPADPVRFPGLQLAWQTLAAAPGSTAVLNAANEEAVAAFLDRRLPFTGIHRVNADAVEHFDSRLGPARSIDDLLELDRRAREHARTAIARHEERAA